MKKVFIFITSILLLTSCKKEMESNMKIASASMMPSNEKNIPEEVKNSNRKLIKNGDIEFETHDLNATYKKIIEKVSKYNCYVSSENDSKQEDRISKNITIRIPSDKFDIIIAELGSEIENFDSKNINIEDVTDQFIDITARLKNKKAVEVQYINILKKATKISDILTIEKQIGELRGDIESIEGNLRMLENQVGFSTLNISFYKETIGTNGFFSELGTSLYNGWRYLLNFIVLLFNLWPFIIIASIIIWILTRKRK